MATPIKAFLGKSYTKNGVTKMYMYNPDTEKYGWYNVGQNVTEKGSYLMSDYEEYEETTRTGDTKANILRTNIKTVIEQVSDSNIDGMDELLDAIYEKVDNMSDYEIHTFAENNKKSINLYFEYRDINQESVDARVMNLAKALGIKIYDYIEADEVPSSVQTTLANINQYVKFNESFEDENEAKNILSKTVNNI